MLSSKARVLRSKVNINVMQKPLSFAIPFNLVMNNKLKNMLLMSKGRSKILFKLEKNAFIPGDTIELMCCMDNTESRKSISSIVLTFYKHVFGIEPVSR